MNLAYQPELTGKSLFVLFLLALVKIPLLSQYRVPFTSSKTNSPNQFLVFVEWVPFLWLLKISFWYFAILYTCVYPCFPWRTYYSLYLMSLILLPLQFNDQGIWYTLIYNIDTQLIYNPTFANEIVLFSIIFILSRIMFTGFIVISRDILLPWCTI